MDTSIVDEASSPSSSSCSSNDEMYDVFLSFIGVDSRKTFTDHLYWTLKDARVDVFIAENKLRGPKLMQAIEQSRIAVIIFSSWYVFSIGCLRELEKIMECRRTLGQMVLPIFYHADPKDVGRQIDSFPVHDRGVKVWEEMMRSWRKSLIEATNLCGLVYTKSDGYEGMFIRKIVDEITRKLNSTCVDIVTKQVVDSMLQEIGNDLTVQVGKDSRLQEISTHLDVGGPNDTRIRLRGKRPSPLKVNKESDKEASTTWPWDKGHRSQS
ncbi:PREDICTED: TMV resistance protein N-like [Prunus mume]|uniref:TMV resistance protein N-like n=1 Tax=Prunus mume TaxID=102107 RepID=A0ABM1LKS7_PRUMU|nr:PREDICTED: TMV resistance protein N-like [Prunus mume]